MFNSKKKVFHLFLAIVLLGGVTLNAPNLHAAGELSLFTPYTNISVVPGETVHYTIEVVNNTSAIQTAKLNVEGPDWNVELTSGGWEINEISVMPDEPETLSLDIDVPLEVEKGEYRFVLTAEDKARLPLVINIAEKGIFRTELTTDQPNLTGHAGSTFNFSAEIKNRSAQQQIYALTAKAPQGWQVTFSSAGKDISSVSVDENGTKTIGVEVVPPEQVKAGTYKIPIRAETNATSAELELEVVITGTYDLNLTTPTEVLSTDITAGKEKSVELVVENNGTAPLRNIQFEAQTPTNWEVTFEPKQIESLEPGKTATVKAVIKANDEAIAGDYIVNISAKTDEKTAEINYRVTVKTSLLWGWIGILIILLVAGGIYYLFRTYGRR